MADQAATITRPEERRIAEYSVHANQRINVGNVERVLCLIGGGALALYGLRRSLGNMLLMLGGGALVYRGFTGHCPAYQAMGISTVSQAAGPDITLEDTVTVNKPVAEVYRFWRNLENRPRFMKHLESVVSNDGKRSRWVAKAPLQIPIKWDAEVEEPYESSMLVWPR
jgi:uncharacterized membrane protein